MCFCASVVLSGQEDFQEETGFSHTLKITTGDLGEIQSPHPIVADEAALNYFKR